MSVARFPVGLLALMILGCTPSGPTETIPASQASDATPTTAPQETTDTEPEPPFEVESDFQMLSLADFTPFPEGVDTWSEGNGRLQCSGLPKGYLASRDRFQNFTWRLEYRFVRPADLKDESRFPGNTGFLVYVTGEPKIWPLCLEIQGKHVQMAAIKENGGAEAPVVEEDEAARQSARKPVGQWNALEIVSRDGALRVSLNGTPISASQPNFLSSGQIGVQAEGHPFDVRRMRIRIDD